jgi:hypothetical protein
MRGEFIGQTKFGRSITSQSPERLSISTVHQFSEILPCLAAIPKTCCCVEGRESVFESLGVEHGQSEFRHGFPILLFCYPFVIPTAQIPAISSNQQTKPATSRESPKLLPVYVICCFCSAPEEGLEPPTR